jgi:polysaccharide chain length determinant protein (PEP-CTERM system associated)
VTREMTLEDYWAAVKRHRWTILIPTLLGPLLGYALTWFLTPEYTSTSLILIEQPKVPSNYVPSVASTDLFTRLATLQEQILSRNRLQPIIERYDLYKRERKTSMEDALAEMRKNISLLPEQFQTAATTGPGGKTVTPPPPPSARSQTVPGFSINYTGSSPDLAQKVCADLTALVIEENLKQREQQAQSTTEFLTSALDNAKQRLDAADAKLAQFKRQYLGAMPDQQQSNLQMLAALNTQLGVVTDALTRAQQGKHLAESMLEQELQAWRASKSGNNPQAMQQDLAKMQEALVTLQARYTPDHPDVIKLKNDIEKLKKAIAEQQASGTKASADTGSPDNGIEPPQIQKLRAEIAAAEAEIRGKTRQQEDIQRRINAVEARLQLSPVVEQQYKDLTRGYDEALKLYDELLAKRSESEMSTELERRQEGEVFEVLDAASLPDSPSFPIWWQFVLGGLGAGLMIGCGIALLRQLGDKSIRDERDIEFYLQLPTLALLPVVDNGNGRRGRLKPPRRQEALPGEVLKA